MSKYQQAKSYAIKGHAALTKKANTTDEKLKQLEYAAVGVGVIWLLWKTRKVFTSAFHLVVNASDGVETASNFVADGIESVASIFE